MEILNQPLEGAREVEGEHTLDYEPSLDRRVPSVKTPTPNLNLNKKGYFPPVHPGEDQLTAFPLSSPRLLRAPRVTARSELPMTGLGAVQRRGEGGRGGDHPGATARSGVEIWGGAVSTTTTPKVPSHAESALTLSHKIRMATGFLCFFPIQNIPP